MSLHPSNILGQILLVLGAVLLGHVLGLLAVDAAVLVAVPLLRLGRVDGLPLVADHRLVAVHRVRGVGHRLDPPVGEVHLNTHLVTLPS